MVYQPKKNYQWSEGFQPKLDANVVGGVVEQIEDEYGEVTKERFLEKSRPEDSVTHCLFEWDDSKAAEKYRLHQARTTIGCLRVVYATRTNDEAPVKAFVNVSEFSDKASYRNVEVVLNDENTREAYLNRIQHELNAFIKRNQNVVELADMLIEAGENLKKGLIE